MRDDKTGWEIVFDGTQELLPPRDSHQSEIWHTTSRRKYTRTGKHTKMKPQEPVEAKDTNNDTL